MTKICIFLAEGFEEVEALTVVDLIRRTDLQITTVSVTGSKYVLSTHGIVVEADRLFEELDYSDVDMLVLPGGMPGTKHLQEHEGLTRLILQFYEADRKLAAICAAPSILGTLGLLRGKRATCFPGFEEALEDAILTQTAVCRADNIITGAGMGVAIDFALEIIKMYKDTDQIQQMKEKIRYQVY